MVPIAPLRTINELLWDGIETQELVEEVYKGKFSGKGVRPMSSTDNLKCWNCKHTGHTSKQCTSVQRSLFCFRCGNQGVITAHCFKCKQGNRYPSATNRESRSTQTID